MTTNERPALADALGGLIGHLHRRIDSAVFDALVESDLTLTQLRVVKSLTGARGPLPISELAAQLGASLPTAGRAVEHLVQHGLADRWEDPADRRSKLVQLTDAGAQLAAAPQAEAKRQIRNFVDELPATVAQDLQSAITQALETSTSNGPVSFDAACAPATSSSEKSRPAPVAASLP